MSFPARHKITEADLGAKRSICQNLAQSGYSIPMPSINGGARWASVCPVSLQRIENA